MDSNANVKHGRDVEDVELTLSDPSEDEMPLIRRSRQLPQQGLLNSARMPDGSSPASFEKPSKQAPPTGFWDFNTSSPVNVKQSSQQALFTNSQGPCTSSPMGIEQADVEQPRIRKKPGPKPWAQRAISKNDTEAKKQVIRAIEKNWGKNFIYHYIPKCHRPLQKRGPGKRPSYRQHEASKEFEFNCDRVSRFYDLLFPRSEVLATISPQMRTERIEALERQGFTSTDLH